MPKQKMNWLFNQPEARKAIVPIGARNLTEIKAVYQDPITKEEEEFDSYSKMVEYGSQQADQEAIKWMKRCIIASTIDDRYLYFRFIRK